MRRPPLTAFYLSLQITFHFIIENQCIALAEYAVISWHD